MAASEQKLNKIFDQNVQITGDLTVDGNLVGYSGDNFYLDGITKSGNTLTFSVNGATNQSYTFGSAAFADTTAFAAASHTHSYLPLSGGTITGNVTFTGADGENALTLSGSSPTLAFTDVTSGADDFYIHVNSNNFYILRDTGGVGDYNLWDSPHPLQIEADTSRFIVFGNDVITSGNIGSQSVSYASSAGDAGTIDGIDSSRIIYGNNASGTNEGNYSDWDALSKTGFYSHSGAAGRWSSAANWSSVLHFRLYDDNNNYASQLGFNTYDNRIYARTRNAGTWTAWDEIITTGNKDSYTYPPASHNHDGTYVKEGGVSFSGEYPVVVRTSADVIYSDANIKFRGSDSRLTVDGSIETPRVKVTGSHNGNFGYASFSWAGSSSYPTLFSDHADRWVMICNPHVPYLENGINGYSGSTAGAVLTYAANASTSTYWQAGIDSNVGADMFSISRANSGWEWYVDNSGNTYSMSSSRATIFYDRESTGYYVDPASTSNLNALTVNGTFTVVNGTINMNNNDGFVYDDGANVMKVKYDGTEYAIWTQANDGSGGGLDADLLDGNHGSYFDHRRYTDSNNYLGGYYVSGGTEKPNSSVFGPGKLKIAMLRGGSNNLGFGGTWNDVLWMSTYTGGDVKRSTALISSKYDNTSLWIAKQNWDAADWGTGYLIYNSGNSNSYSQDWYANAFYYDDWVRNHSNNNGLYWSGTGWHLYPKNSSDFYLQSGASDASIQFRRGSTAASYIHNASDNAIGFLTTARSWSLRVDDSKNVWAYGSMRSPIYYDEDNTGYYLNPAGQSRLGNIERLAHNTGFLVGSYNSVGANSTNTNPIYTIGDSYKPGTTTLSNMYGIGYSHPNASFINMTGASGWGMYVAADGDARVWLDGSQGRASGTGAAYFPVYYDYSATSRFVDPAATGTSIRVSGDIIAYYSDERLKDIEQNIPNALDKVKSLNGFYYTPNEKAQKLGYKKKRQVGLSAQEVEAVLPELIKEAPVSPEYKTVDYAKLVPLLVEAIKEQQEQIEELKSLINKS